MLTQLNYGFDGELVSEKFLIEEVIEVIPFPNMDQLGINLHGSKKGRSKK